MLTETVIFVFLEDAGLLNLFIIAVFLLEVQLMVAVIIAVRVQ